MNWKTISSEYLVKSKYFTAIKDKCETPEGKIIPEYYVVELGLTLCALAITEDDKVIMVKQYRHALKKTTIEIPGGFIDDNEEPEKAIARELLEETGYAFSKYELLAEVAANGGLLNNYTQLYLATGGKKVSKQQLDENEDIYIQLISVNTLIEMLLQNKIVQSLHANCIFYAMLKMGRLEVS